MNRHAGKVALVTGGHSGIGGAIAGKLRKEGARVFTAQRSKVDDANAISADLADPDTPADVIDEIINREGRLDILINNAGVMVEATVAEMTLADWEKTISVNLRAPFLLIKHAVPYLKDGGSIVNIGSIEGLGANPKHPAYCASKAGLHGLTRAVAVDHGPEGIRCNAVAPGWIETDLNIGFVEQMPNPQSFRQEIGKLHPIGRTGHPDEVASLVSWLASDEAGFVTGQIYTVDGGRMAKLPLP